ncbi:MAG TPA: HEAT repeat domain-containing protein [bacterium]|nr:HEAT repeat domain-containing protein [bacterium]
MADLTENQGNSRDFHLSDSSRVPIDPADAPRLGGIVPILEGLGIPFQLSDQSDPDKWAELKTTLLDILRGDASVESFELVAQLAYIRREKFDDGELIGALISNFEGQKEKVEVEESDFIDYRKNVIVAIGTLGIQDPMALNFLMRVYVEGEGGCSDEAEKALASIVKQADENFPIDVLTDRLGDQEPKQNSPLVYYIIHLLGILKSREAIDSILPYLEEDFHDDRTTAIIALGDIGDTRVIPFLKKHLDPDLQNTDAALNSLAKIGGQEAIDAIEGVFSTSDEQSVMLRAARLLLHIGKPEKVLEKFNALIPIQGDENSSGWEFVDHIIIGLSFLESDKVTRYLGEHPDSMGKIIDLLDNPAFVASYLEYIIRILGRSRLPGSVSVLAGLLNQSDPEEVIVRRNIYAALLDNGREEAIGVLADSLFEEGSRSLVDDIQTYLRFYNSASTVRLLKEKAGVNINPEIRRFIEELEAGL